MIYELWKEAGGFITTSDGFEHGESGFRGLLASIGVSPDSEFYYNTIDPGKVVGAKWKGYRLEMLGVVVGQYSKIGIPSDVSLRKREDTFRLIRMFPYETFSSPEYPDHIIRPCRVRAHYGEVPIFAERIMDGDDEGLAIRFPTPRFVAGRGKAVEFQAWHFEPQFQRQHLDKTIKGLDLLRDHVKWFGRQKGSRTYSKADFFDSAVEAYCKYYLRKKEHPTDEQLAEELHLSESAFHSHKRDYGFRKNNVRAEAMRHIAAAES